MSEITTKRRSLRRVLWMVVGTVILLGAGIGLLIFLSGGSIGSFETKLHDRLYKSGTIGQIKTKAQQMRDQYPPGALSEVLDPPEDLRSLGVNFVIVNDETQDMNGRSVWFEFAGGFGHSGVVICRPGFDPSKNGTGRYHRWEDGVWYRCD